MRKIVYLFGLSLLPATSSCASEEITEAEEAGKAIVKKYDKTPEMLNFEQALKEWMTYKQQNKAGTESAATQKAVDELIISPSRELLLFSGVPESEIEKISANTDELVSFQYAR